MDENIMNENVPEAGGELVAIKKDSRFKKGISLFVEQEDMMNIRTMSHKP